MLKDKLGLTVTASGVAAVAAFDATVDGYLSFARDTGERLKATLAADPDMVLGHCLKVYFLHLLGAGWARARAAKALAEAEARAAAADARERRHVAALGRWCAGDLGAAVAAWEAILAEWPLDVVAMKLAHYGRFYMGDPAALRDSATRALAAWDETLPRYGSALGMHAFGLEEAGDYAEAEAAGRRAVELAPGDPWCVHAVAHVFEMQDRHREGLAWIDRHEPAWSACNNFRYHLWWHRALMLLDLGRADEALELYDARLWDAQSDEYLDLCNDASLLQRLELAGFHVGDRWQALAEKVRGRVDEHVLAFIDAHFALTLAAAGEQDAADRLLASLAEAAPGTRADRAMLTDTADPLCRGLIAYRQGEHARAVACLLPIRERLSGVGGSRAQRDLFEQVLIAAAIADGDLRLARSLLAERTAQAPGDAPGWRLYADVLGRLGEAAPAGQAAERAERLGAG
jgi:tetratricopeptide (TPR) repeat protein